MTYINFTYLFNHANLKDVSNLFKGCKSLVSLDMSNLDTKNVTNMEYMSYGCSSLKTIKLNFNTENVKFMNNMFSYCFSLSSIDLSNFNTKNVNDMSGMFSFCSSLTSIDFSKILKM